MKKGRITALLLAVGLAVTSIPAVAAEKKEEIIAGPSVSGADITVSGSEGTLEKDMTEVFLEKNGVIITEVMSCSGADREKAVDNDTDTFWTSKDKHTPDNRHDWQCRFDKSYNLTGITLTLGRLTNNKWGFIPENLTVEILEKGEYTVVAELTDTSEVMTISLPDDTMAEGIRLSFLDAKSKGFSIREAAFAVGESGDDGKTKYTEKKVYADYHGPRYTREHDGSLGNWAYAGEAKNSSLGDKRVVRDADLILENGKRQLAADAYPVVGMQSQMDQDYQEYQILLAKMANIDGFFIEWGYPGHGTDTQLELMMEVAEKYDFELGINWCDAWHMKDWITAVKPDVVTREEKVQEAVNSLNEILDKLYASPVGAVYDGHPLVYLFGGGFEKPELQKIIGEAKIPEAFEEKRPWYFRRASVLGSVDASGKVNYSYTGSTWHDTVDGPFGWVPERVRNARQDGIGDYDIYGTREDALAYLETLRQAMIADKNIPLRNSVVSPGMDNRSCAGWGDKFKFLDREEGKLYRELWNYQVENRDYLDVVYIASWNDYTEGHQIEPTVEDGYRELLTTQEYAYRFKGGGNQDKSGFELPAELFSLRKLSEKLESAGYCVETQEERLSQAGQAVSKGNYEQAESILQEVRAELSELESGMHVEKIVCGTGEIQMEEGQRLNVAYGRPVATSAAGEGAELTVDGISKTQWHYEGKDTYLEIDLGRQVNVVSGEMISDSPFTLWYWKGEELLPANLSIEEDWETKKHTFFVQPSVTSDKIRLVFEENSGNVAEIKLYENKMPRIELVSPVSGEETDFTRPWELCVRVRDDDSAVKELLVSVDDTLVAPLEKKTEGELYTLTMEPVSEQIHRIFVRAVDEQGAAGVTDTIVLYPPLENVALHKPVQANVQFQNFGPDLAVDGIISLESRWRTPSDMAEHWLEIDLQDRYEICRADLYMGDDTGFAVQNFRLEYWENGEWNTIPGTEFTENKTKDISLSFEPVTTSRVRFYSNEAVGRGVRLKEIEIYAPAAAKAGTFAAGTGHPSHSASDFRSWNAVNKCFAVLPDTVTEKLRNRFFEGKLSFSYLDEGNDTITLSAASDDKAAFGDFKRVAEIHKTNTGEWKTATIAFSGTHLVMQHEAENDSDFVFSGNAVIRDMTVEFMVYSGKE